VKPKLIEDSRLPRVRRCYKVMLLTGSNDPATPRFYEDAGFEQSKTGFQARRISAGEV
jgi:hypothetical protein